MSQELHPFRRELGAREAEALAAARDRYRGEGPSQAARERMRARIALVAATPPATAPRIVRRPWFAGSLLGVAALLGWALTRTPAQPGAASAPPVPPRVAIEASPDVTPEPVVLEPEAPVEPVVAPRAQAAPAKRVRMAPPSEGELSLLQRARRALTSDPDESLRISDTHRRLYPRGTFAEERELLHIEALVALSRRSEARSAAASFAKTYPSSAHRARIAHITGARLD